MRLFSIFAVVIVIVHQASGAALSTANESYKAAIENEVSADINPPLDVKDRRILRHVGKHAVDNDGIEGEERNTPKIVQKVLGPVWSRVRPKAIAAGNFIVRMVSKRPKTRVVTRKRIG